MSTTTAVPREEFETYKGQSKLIEQQLKAWEHEIKLRHFNENCERCHKAFNELRSSIATVSDAKIAEKYEKECFEITRNLIAFFDCHVPAEDLNYIYKHKTTSSFAHLWDCIHEYCNDIICKYEWARQY